MTYSISVLFMIVGYTSLLHILFKKNIYMSDWASITFYIEIRSSQHDRDVDTRNPGAMDIRPHSPPELWDDLVYLIKKFQLRMQIWFSKRISYVMFKVLQFSDAPKSTQIIALKYVSFPMFLHYVSCLYKCQFYPSFHG